MKKLFLFTWLIMLSIVTVAQNEQSGNELVIKNGAELSWNAFPLQRTRR